MLEGALIGMIVAVIVLFIKKNQEKKALAKATNSDVIDQPDFAAFFHYASEKTQSKNGLKFFDHNGALTISGTLLNYVPQQARFKGVSVDLKEVKICLAPVKRKMKWVEIDVDGTKHYFTTFSQGAFSVDRSQMDEFISKLEELQVL